MIRTCVVLLGLAIFATAGTYTLSYSESQFEFSVENGYDRVRSAGMSAVGDAGSPELPVQSLVFMIPNGKKVASIEILSLNTTAYSNTYDIYPLQPLYKMNEEPPPWVPRDPEIYDKDALYPDTPVKVVEHGRVDGIPIVSIVVVPLLYNPVRDSIYLVEDITFSLNLESSKYASRPRIRSQRAHEIYMEHIQGSVYNDWEVGVYYSPPNQVIPLANYSQYPQEPNFHDVVIISPPTMSEAFKPLESWLMEKGLPARIVTTDWIYNNYDGIWDSTDYARISMELEGDNAAQIKEFLYDSWFNDGTCYALLVGIAETGMPYRQLYGSGDHPSDLYYQDFDGDWWSVYPTPSRYEEMWVGRVPAWDYEQAVGWVYKRLTYEKAPANTDEMSKALWISQDNEPGGWAFESHMNWTIEVTEFDQYMEQHKVVGHPCNPSNHGLIDTLNRGYGFCSHYGHGAGDTWKTKYYSSSPKELLVTWDWDNYPSYEQFENEDKYYVVWSVGCATAHYDTVMWGSSNCTGWNAMSPLPCCAEGFVSWYDEQYPAPPNSTYPIGAVAYDGDVRPGGTPDISMHRNFIMILTRSRSLWDGTRLGNIHARQKYGPMYGPDFIPLYYCMIRHLFGSPEMVVWQHKPKILVHEHIGSIEEDVTNEIMVTVYEISPGGDSVPLHNATVVLYKGCSPTYEIFELARTDSEGKVNFVIAPENSGWLKVTTTAKDHIPYQTKIRVKPGKGLEEQTLREIGSQTLKENPNLVFAMVVPTIVKTLTLKYTVPETQNLRLDVYDITGSRIATMERIVKPGCYDYSLKNLSSGVYFLVLKGKETITRKVLVIR